MLDIKRIRENLDDIKKAMDRRGEKEFDLDAVVALDDERRELLKEVEVMKNEMNIESKKIPQLIKEGKDVRVTIVGVLSDPDALGEERITMYNCWFNDLNLMDFEIGKLVEEEIGGGFTDFEYIDSVEPPAK